MVVAVQLNTGDWIGLAGIVVAIAIALVQAFRAGRKADAASKAVERTQRQIAGASLLLSTTDLERLERGLRTEAARGERQRSRDGALDWRRAAEEYTAALQAAKVDDEPLHADLALALSVVDIALDDLADTSITPERACRVLLQYAGRACGASRRVATAMMLTPDREMNQ